MSHSDRDDGKDKKQPEKGPEDLTDEAIIEWLSREPQQPGSREFREKVMQDIRQRQPNVHRKAFCPSAHQSRLAGLLTRLCPNAPTLAALALALGFVAGFVTAVAFGSRSLPTDDPAAAAVPIGTSSARPWLIQDPATAPRDR